MTDNERVRTVGMGPEAGASNALPGSCLRQRAAALESEASGLRKLADVLDGAAKMGAWPDGDVYRLIRKFCGE